MKKPKNQIIAEFVFIVIKDSRGNIKTEIRNAEGKDRRFLECLAGLLSLWFKKVRRQEEF